MGVTIGGKGGRGVSQICSTWVGFWILVERMKDGYVHLVFLTFDVHVQELNEGHIQNAKLINFHID